MGFATPSEYASNTTGLPVRGQRGAAFQLYPTVLPVAAGGYFWVFFDSTTGPSHPAFYVTGQEFGTGNHRAFAALDPWRADGDSCTSGVDR